jgi:DNA polymerase I-like protein with 3'-5' exonuclease and polymerase domains
MILLPRHDAFHLLSQVSVKEAKQTVNLWYSDRKEVLTLQKKCKQEALDKRFVCTLLGRPRQFPSKANFAAYQKGHIDIVGDAINTLLQVLPFFLIQSFMLTLSPLAV